MREESQIELLKACVRAYASAVETAWARNEAATMAHLTHAQSLLEQCQQRASGGQHDR